MDASIMANSRISSSIVDKTHIDVQEQRSGDVAISYENIALK
jgi:hypothetical protein